MLSKEVSRTIFKVFGMTRPGIEPRSPGPLANTLPTVCVCVCVCAFVRVCVCVWRMAIEMEKGLNRNSITLTKPFPLFTKIMLPNDRLLKISVNEPTYFRSLHLNVEMTSSCLKNMEYVLFALP